MKKQLPLLVLESLEKYVLLKGQNFETVDPDKFLLKIVDKDPESDFYFNVETYQVENRLKLLVDWKPANKETTGNRRIWIDGKDLDAYFSTWLNLLKKYETVNSFFDDPFTKSFADEFYGEFEIVDENADVTPLTINQILLIEEHLENIDAEIDKFRIDKNSLQIEDIKKSIQSLKESLGSKSKAWILKNLSFIWARIVKLAPHVLKEILSESKRQIIKEGIKYLIEHGPELIR